MTMEASFPGIREGLLVFSRRVTGYAILNTSRVRAERRLEKYTAAGADLISGKWGGGGEKEAVFRLKEKSCP